MKKKIKKIIKNHFLLENELYSLIDDIDYIHNKIIECLNSGNKIIFCGNGGSAADSQHLSAEFAGRFIKERKPLNSISLTTDTSALTAIANDYSFNDVFRRQLEAVGKPNDILIGISTSGNSKNIYNAVKFSNDNSIKTICLLGCDGGIISKISDLSLIVPSYNTARIQEMHILIGHILCELVDSYY